MVIDTRGIGFVPTNAILRHVESRATSALRAFSNRVLKATVRLEDVNADHGGVDKRCRLVVALRRRRMEVAEATDADLYRAIDLAFGKLHRAVSRVIQRSSSRERKDRQRPGALVAR